MSQRLFIAVPLPASIMEELMAVSQSLPHPKIRWLPAESLHITLYFFGATNTEQLPMIVQKITTITSNYPVFTLSFLKLTDVSYNGRPSMIWAEFLPHPVFAALYADLQQFNMAPNFRLPRPHVTLARIKNLRWLPPNWYLPEISLPPISIGQVELWESKLYSTGAVYCCVEIFPLQQNG